MPDSSALFAVAFIVSSSVSLNHSPCLNRPTTLLHHVLHKQGHSLHQPILAIGVVGQFSVVTTTVQESRGPVTGPSRVVHSPVGSLIHPTLK